MEIIAYVKLIAVRSARYTMYVFKNLEDNTFIMCTRLPDWQTPDIKVGDVGFLKYQPVQAGEEYFDPSTGEVNVYKYTNIYFLNFVLEADETVESNIIV